MEASFVSIVHQELKAARDHLTAMVESLTEKELWWVPPRPDGTAISYHLGHIGLVEDMRVSQAQGKQLLGPETYRNLFGVANNSNPKAVFPGREDLFTYLAQARARTLALLDTLQLDTLPAQNRPAEADFFRGIINHEYSHTKYIRRLLGEMGKSTNFPLPSSRVEMNPQAIAAPQYFIPHWPEVDD
jgi:hypothetical protein